MRSGNVHSEWEPNVRLTDEMTDKKGLGAYTINSELWGVIELRSSQAVGKYAELIGIINKIYKIHSGDIDS